jgi:DNA-binding transcriptional regulator YdaS (Cro superfamily)
LLDVKKQDAALKVAIKTAGGARPLARVLGITHAAVLAWKAVPLRHLFRIEEITGIPREMLRPDIFGAPRPRKRG